MTNSWQEQLEHVIWNRSTPVTLLRTLAAHEDEQVRSWARDALQER